MRLLALDARTPLGDQTVPTSSDQPAAIANIDPDSAAPDVPPAELLAWVRLSSCRVCGAQGICESLAMPDLVSVTRQKSS
jgi:hypothetical protein